MIFSGDIPLLLRCLDEAKAASVEEALDLERLREAARHLRYWQANWTTRNLVVVWDEDNIRRDRRRNHDLEMRWHCEKADLNYRIEKQKENAA